MKVKKIASSLVLINEPIDTYRFRIIVYSALLQVKGRITTRLQKMP